MFPAADPNHDTPTATRLLGRTQGTEWHMQAFEWAEHNLGIQTPHELQHEGVNVYFAPMIAPGEKVVDLASGRVERFFEGEERPRTGYYAQFGTLERFCRHRGLPLVETDGQVSVEPAGTKEAGDPLLHGGT